MTIRPDKHKSDEGPVGRLAKRILKTTHATGQTLRRGSENTLRSSKKLRITQPVLLLTARVLLIRR